MRGLDNPYAPPQANEPDPLPASSVELLDATRGARLANMIVDDIGRITLTGIVGYVLGLLGIEDLTVLAGWAVFLGYHAVFEYTLGRTPGKFITGTRVVTDTGLHPTFLQIAGRTLARCIPFEPLSFLGSRPTGWHDRLSGTRVIRLRGTLGD